MPHIYFRTKQWLLSASFFLICLPVFSQSTDFIRSSGQYYYGLGTGSNYQSARRNALENLSESISVQIQSAFKQVVEDTGEDVQIYTESVVSTYSSAVVSRYDHRVLTEEPNNIEIIVYIKKAHMQEAFRQREQLVHDFIHLGEKAGEDLRIADALRYYYWALVLARSHPDNTRLRYHFGGEQEQSLMLTLSDRISSIFSFIRAEVVNVEEREQPPQKRIHLNFFYRNQPLQDLDYTYWVGDGFSGLYSASNGIGYAVLDGVVAKELSTLRLLIEYQYANKARLEDEVRLMMESVVMPYFDRAEIRLSLTETRLAPPVTPPAHSTVAACQIPDQADYEGIVMQVLQAISNNSHEAISNHFTSEGYRMYQDLIKNGNVTVLQNRMDTLRIIRVGNEIMVRSVPMLFAFDNNRERFIEHVSFSFNQQAKISGLSFSLSDVAINDILSKPDAFGSEEEKFFLIKFMEDYKTAYALKRIDYIDAIFDENALIIVGNVVQRVVDQVENVAGMYGQLSTEQVEYIRLEKSAYIERLRRIFQRNEFINLRFEDNLIRKTQKDDRIYGIQIAQHYYSSTYADKGYLFLMLDLNDTLNPKIYVRTWQPEKHPDGSIFGLEDFRF